VSKFAASFLSGSSAMFSEAIHSCVDTGNQILLLYGTSRARQPPSRRHPFGHARELYFWSFVVAILIFGLGAGVSIYEGMAKLLRPQPLESPIVNYAVLAIAAGIEATSFTIALRQFRRKVTPFGIWEGFRRSKDPKGFIVLFEDSAALIGLAIAFFGILLDHLFSAPLFDGMASLLIGVELAVVASLLAYECKGLLIGEGARADVVEGIEQLAADDPAIDRVSYVLTVHLGPDDVLAAIGLDFVDALTADRIEKASTGLRHRIHQRFPEVKRIFLAVESLERAAEGQPAPTS
jgi:cation diffusion facilitator family transporter